MRRFPVGLTIAMGGILTDMLLKRFYRGLDPLVDVLLVQGAVVLIAAVILVEAVEWLGRFLEVTPPVLVRLRFCVRLAWNPARVMEEPCPYCLSGRKYKHCHAKFRPQ